MITAHNRRRRSPPAEEHVDDRWLLTYSDMITLLMALFIVMWAISSVNISKFDELKVSLNSAFSGKILAENSSVLTGGSAPFAHAGAPVERLSPSQPAFRMPSIAAQLAQEAAERDVENLDRIRQRLEAFAERHGFAGRFRASIDEEGLVLQLLTDEVLFGSGDDVLKARSLPLLGAIAGMLRAGGIENRVRVEGNTDSIPISSSRFSSNWELSTARAGAVLHFLLAHGVQPSRLSLVGHGAQRPLATNGTAAGRSLNRRVNLVVLRRSEGSSAP